MLLTRLPYGKDLPFYSHRYLDTNRLGVQTTGPRDQQMVEDGNDDLVYCLLFLKDTQDKTFK